MAGDENKVQFRAAGALAEQLAQRVRDTTLGELARRELGRYYDLLGAALASVELSEGEALLIVDALNGTFINATAAQMLAYEIRDVLDDGLAEKWQVDGPALVARLKASTLTLTQRWAILDAVERFWHLNNISDSRARVRAVGLVRDAI